VSDGLDHRLAAALRRVPHVAGAGEPVRLAGLTNVNYRVGEFVVRIAGDGTSEYIDRSHEQVAAIAAAAAGVNAEVVFFDVDDGLMVTRFVDGARTMTAESFADLDAVARAGRVFRQLHTTSAAFAVDFELFTMIDDYRAVLAAKDAPLPDGYETVLAAAVRARAALARRPAERVPSHCDPLCENFLDTGARMYLIDYEYAGNNDPMWDLGDLSVEGGFDAEQDSELLHAYFDGPPPTTDAARMVIYKAMCDLLWTLWGVIQHIDGNPADDFWTYAVGRLQRCSTLMASREFDDALAVLS
jgi:thiamine kinase-like enzyme